MKVYKFFRIPSKNDITTDLELDIERKYTLYAITNNKDYAKRFKSDRNMNKFICKIHDDVDSDEYAEMCNIDRGCVLEFKTLTTIFDNNHTLKNSDKKEVLMTYWEYQMIDDYNTILDDEETWKYMPFPGIFKNKYRKMLNTLEYVTYYKLMTSNNLPLTLSKLLYESDDDGDYAAPSLLFDQVAMFIKMIKETL